MMQKLAVVAAKAINQRYFKNISQSAKNKLGGVVLKEYSPYKDSQLNFQTYITQKIAQKSLPKPQPIVSLPHLFDQVLFQHTPNPFQQPSTQKEETQSCISTKQTTQSQPNIEMGVIESLQFEANRPIQDRMVHKTLESIGAECISIFDGHGGNTLSEYASKKITQLIDCYLISHLPKKATITQKQKSIDIIKDSIQWAYAQIEQSFCELLEHQLKTGNKDIIKIGTCAITCVLWEDFIIVANCGDSQAIIVKQKQSGLCYQKVNEQLNTSNLNQLTRIQKEFQGIDDQVLIKSKINSKVYIKGILQPTRTLGDYYLKKQKYFQKISKGAKTPFKGPYVKHTPEFRVISVDSSFRYLILASDGLWDFVTKKQVLKLVQTHITKQSQQFHGITEDQLNKAYIQGPVLAQTKKLTESLRDHVLQKCAKNKCKTLQELMQIPPGERRNFCDDISIITVSFRQNSLS